MARLKVRWLKTALRNLDAEIAYIAERDPRAAIETAARLFDIVERLADFPESGRLGRVDGTRELVVPDLPYILPYRVTATTVDIIRVFHAARRWPETFKG